MTDGWQGLKVHARLGLKMPGFNTVNHIFDNF